MQENILLALSLNQNAHVKGETLILKIYSW